MKTKDINRIKTSNTQMKKVFSFLIVGILFFSLVGAKLIGTYKIDEPMEITNFCQDGTCTYMNLTSIELPNNTIIYPNLEMTNNNQDFNFSYAPDQLGTYTFKTCGNPSGEIICDRDTFEVTLTGGDSSNKQILAFIFIGLFFIITFITIIYFRKKFDEEKWYNKMQRQYENRNFVKLVFSGIGYSFLKNMFVIYYSLGFIILNLVADVSFTYNIASIYTLMKSLLFIYAWGFALVGILFLGKIQEWIMDFVEQFREREWGGYN